MKGMGMEVRARARGRGERRERRGDGSKGKGRGEGVHAPLHSVGAGFFVPVGLVLSRLGTHLKGILSPMISSKYPS